MNQKLETLRDAIIHADGEAVGNLLAEINESITYSDVFSESIEPALNTLCESIQNRKGAVPELLMGLKEVERISSALDREDADKAMPSIIFGVVEGDIHDMGKNVVRDVCKGYGYNIIDLGKDVSVTTFAETAREKQPAMVCLSTMMSTTVESMVRTISALRASNPEIRIVIGGAFMDRAMADKLAADGYAEDASTIMDEIKRVLH